jgi:hypothetical protein
MRRAAARWYSIRRAGYWQLGGKFMPSTIAELGYVIERHLQSIGLLKKPELDVHQKKLVDEKRVELEPAPSKPTRSQNRIFRKVRSFARSAAPRPW